MNREKTFDLIAVILIAVIGLFAAYITFGILDSSASGQIQSYKVGGAIAGALVTISLLASVYLQFRKSSESDELRSLREDKENLQQQLSREDELKELRRQNVELQQKLLRGAPRPEKFVTEVSERESIVLARPDEWEPRGGTIFDFELPDKNMLEGDIFPARFTCWYVPIEENEQEDFYRRFVASVFNAPFVESHTSEYVYLSGGTPGIRSLKVIAQEYVCIQIQKEPVTEKVTRVWWNVTKDEYDRQLAAINAPPEATNSQSPAANAPQAPAGEPQPVINPAPEQVDGEIPVSQQEQPIPDVYWKIFRMRVVCFHEALGKIFFLEFLDDLNEFTNTSAMFNQILGSVRFLS